MLRFRMDGFDEARRKLERLQKNANDLSGKQEVPMAELFSPDFMRRYSQVADFDALLSAGGYRVESQDDFEAIPDEEWEAVVQAHTRFNSWQEMMDKAAGEYAARRVVEGL